MPRRNRSEELDRAVEAILEGAPIPLAPGRGGDDGELTDLLRIAAVLRGLPRARFRDELGAALRPQIAAHDLRDAVKGLPQLELRRLGALDRATIGVFRFTGQAPWERHPDGDELLHVLEGDVDLTVLTDDGPRQVPIGAGEVFVCPRGLWHRQRSKTGATILFATPTATSEASWAEDPRSERSE